MADVNIITEDFINSSAINSSALANAKKISKQGKLLKQDYQNQMFYITN